MKSIRFVLFPLVAIFSFTSIMFFSCKRSLEKENLAKRMVQIKFELSSNHYVEKKDSEFLEFFKEISPDEKKEPGD